MQTADQIDKIIAAKGEPIVLRRKAVVAGIQTSVTDLSLIGKVNYLTAAQLIAGGPVVQTDREVRIGTSTIRTASWPAPPRKDDQVQIGGAWAMVLSVNVLRSPTETLGYVLRVRG